MKHLVKRCSALLPTTLFVPLIPRTILPAHSRTFFIKAQLLQNAHHPAPVAISTPQQLSSLFLQLQAQPALASKINTLEYNHAEVTMEQAEDGLKGMERPSIKAQYIADITFILEQITQRGRLESFKWIDEHPTDNDVTVKSTPFWTALPGASTTLNHLRIDFGIHELDKLHRLHDVVSVMTAPLHILLMNLVEDVSCSLLRASEATA
jgi:hypothetical protein